MIPGLVIRSLQAPLPPPELELLEDDELLDDELDELLLDEEELLLEDEELLEDDELLLDDVPPHTAGCGPLPVIVM